MIKFGIEIETCCKIDSKKRYDSIYDFAPDYIQKLSKLAKKKEINFEFLNVVDEEKIYDEITWMIDEDITINCNNGIPVEIITPIMTKPEEFKNVFQNIILDDHFIYESNNSQGIHINLSHPKQDTKNFLQFWWYFEPLLLRFLSFERQQKIEKYFDRVVGADTSPPKPSPDMLKALESEFPEMDLYVMVGDRGEDMMAAKSAGFFSYFIDHGTIHSNSLPSDLTDRRLASLDEIVLYIEEDWNLNRGR